MRVGALSLLAMVGAAACAPASPPAVVDLARGHALTASDLHGPLLQYFGQPVMSSVNILALNYGNGVDSRVLNVAPGFYSSLLTAPEWAWMDEYAVTTNGRTQYIDPGSFLGILTFSPHNPNPITDEDLQAELVFQFAAGTIPAPSSNTLYVIHLPPALSGLRSGTHRLCSNWCAYHHDLNYNGLTISYAVMPDYWSTPCYGYCAFEPDLVRDFTAVASHEIFEAVTDPPGSSDVLADGGLALAWFDPNTPDPGSNHEEIGDLCQAPLGGTPWIQDSDFDAGPVDYAVQKLWSNRYDGCLTSVADAFRAHFSPPYPVWDGGLSTQLTLLTDVPSTGPTSVDLWLAPVPAGVTASLSATRVTTGQSATISLSVAPGVQTSFLLQAYTGSSKTIAFARATVRSDDDFTWIDPGVLHLQSSQSSVIDVHLVPLPATSPGPISVSIASTASGVDASVASADFDGGITTARIALSVVPGTPSAGVGPLVTLNASSPRTRHAIPLLGDVSGDDFSIQSDSSEVVLKPRGSGTLSLSTSVTHGGPVPLHLSASQVPDGVTVTFGPPDIEAGQPTQLTATATSNAPVGSSTVAVSAQSPVTQRSIDVLITVRRSGCSVTGGESLLALCALAAHALGAARRRRG